MKVEMGKKYMSAGFLARPLATDLKGEYPVAMAVDYGHREEVQAFTADGKWVIDGQSLKDLKLVVPERFTLTRWVNVYRRENGLFIWGSDYPSKQEARTFGDLSSSTYIGTYPVTITGEIPEE